MGKKISGAVWLFGAEALADQRNIQALDSPGNIAFVGNLKLI
jgi:hypothetical protein